MRVGAGSRNRRGRACLRSPAPAVCMALVIARQATEERGEQHGTDHDPHQRDEGGHDGLVREKCPIYGKAHQVVHPSQGREARHARAQTPADAPAVGVCSGLVPSAISYSSSRPLSSQNDWHEARSASKSSSITCHRMSLSASPYAWARRLRTPTAPRRSKS